MNQPTTDPGTARGALPGSPDSRAGRQAVQIADVFVQLADTLIDDFDVVEVLDLLVRTCVDVLGSTAAGLLLGDQRGHLSVMAASAESSRLLEVCQVQNNEGPCLEAYRTRARVTVTDLSTHRDRWPRFVPMALDSGFRSVHALPLRLRTETIGALNLFHDDQPALTGNELRIAQALADTATIGILQQRALHGSTVLAEQLQTALNSRIAIEQAKGVLAAHGGLDMEESFQVLRRYARHHNLRLSELSQAVASRQLDPQLLLAHAARS